MSVKGNRREKEDNLKFDGLTIFGKKLKPIVFRQRNPSHLHEPKCDIIISPVCLALHQRLQMHFGERYMIDL
jgi:hypothetical protein